MTGKRILLVTALLTTAGACTPVPAPTPVPSNTPPPPSTPTSTVTPGPTPTPSPVPSPTPVTHMIRTPIPATTLDMLAVEPPLRPFDFIVVNAEPPRRVTGATRAFWVADGTTGSRREITARLRAQTDYIAMWVEEGVWHDVREMERAAPIIETQVYATVRAVFGSEWVPGVDNDAHIHILHASGLGDDTLGYTSGADAFPSDHYPWSNEAEMVTVNIDRVEIGSPAYYTLLARQIQRLIQWHQDRSEARWVKEGLAELAAWMVAPGLIRAQQPYLEQPDTSLTGWAWEGEQAAVHRGAAYLFMAYFHQRFGDEGIRAVMAQPLNGAAGFDAALAELGSDLSFEDLFAEWLVTNVLDDQPGYGYTALEVESPACAAVFENYPLTIEPSVEQFGADYVRLRGNSDLRVRFTGATATPLLGVLPHSGRSYWWSNRADESLATLTRAFDLTAAEATLTYWMWYDIEPGYDYATVEVSTDGGGSWQMLPAEHNTDADPYGNNPGWGYTGASGDPAGWLEERVDLSPYAGGQVLVRFTYLTDEAVTGAGLVLDDIAIPEIGYSCDAETADGWQAAGFVRSDNLVPQRYAAQLIGLGDAVSVERLPLEADQTAEWSVPLASRGWREAVLVLSGLAPLTTHPALYQLSIEAVEQ